MNPSLDRLAVLTIVFGDSSGKVVVDEIKETGAYFSASEVDLLGVDALRIGRKEPGSN
jgi:hypothetical protein